MSLFQKSIFSVSGRAVSPTKLAGIRAFGRLYPACTVSVDSSAPKFTSSQSGTRIKDLHRSNSPRPVFRVVVDPVPMRSSVPV
jgi:hypothetical protein